MRTLLLALTLNVFSRFDPGSVDTDLVVVPGGQHMFSKLGQTWENHVAWGEPEHDQNDLNCAACYKGTAHSVAPIYRTPSLPGAFGGKGASGMKTAVPCGCSYPRVKVLLG